MDTRPIQEQKILYAQLLIKLGVNLQPGQSLRLSSELEHADFTRMTVAAAYRAGARYVQVDWLDSPATRERLLHSKAEFLDYFPQYEISRHRQMLDEGWARLSLVGPSHPNAMQAVDPVRMRRAAMARSTNLEFYMQGVMNNQLRWCVAAVPTRAWAQQVYPDLPVDDAVAALWHMVLKTCRMDEDDPVAAWERHDLALRRIARFLGDGHFSAVRYLDTAVDAEGKPNTDLTVGLTDRPHWIAASSQTPDGLSFLPNMPTEEVFTTPHRARIEGWARTSKPAFPLTRKVDGAYFRFEAGELVEYRAHVGQDVLDEFFSIPGASRLGEVSLVDDRSPINQANLIFYETLFDENAVSHIAFGQAYAEGMVGGNDLPPKQYKSMGINESTTHVDFMIGTSTMRVIGMQPDGGQVVIMEEGRFLPDAMAG